MKHKFSRLLMTLVALFAMTTGAWAQTETLLTTIENTGDNASFISGSKTFDNIATVTFSGEVYNEGGEGGWCSYQGITLTVTAAEGYTITSVKFYNASGSAFDEEAPFEAILELGGDLEDITKVNGTSIGTGGVTKIEVYGYADTPAGPEVTWNAATKTGTFDMPGSDVVLTPEFAPVAQWATESDVELLPTAAEGIFAGTTDPIIVEGTVAPGQGTVMYAVTSTNQATVPELSAFSATVPTAENIADEGADVLVWYYIQGADAPDGQEATAENTFNDSEICATPLEVSVLSNQFDITFNAANANTIEAGKATVTVGGTAATVTEGKLEGVKMGSEVKMTAKQGYKFRKVEAKKTILVTGITLNKTATTIVIGSTETLRVTAVTPDNANDKTVTWSSDKESVATVDANGKVTAVAAGTANITATANDGSGVSATCAVTVTLTYPIALSAVTSDYVGSVVCSDGNVYPAKTAAPAGKTAVGILGKVTATGHGLILALKNATSQKWNTINGWTSVTTYASTTLKVLPANARGSSLTSYTALGETAVSNWAVAQKGDYEAIFTNLGSTVNDGGKTYDGNVNAYITTGVGGTAISGRYWSATVEDEDFARTFESSFWDSYRKTTSCSVRPVLGF